MTSELRRTLLAGIPNKQLETIENLRFVGKIGLPSTCYPGWVSRDADWLSQGNSYWFTLSAQCHQSPSSCESDVPQIHSTVGTKQLSCL